MHMLVSHEAARGRSRPVHMDTTICACNMVSYERLYNNITVFICDFFKKYKDI